MFHKSSPVHVLQIHSSPCFTICPRNLADDFCSALLSFNIGGGTLRDAHKWAKKGGVGKGKISALLLMKGHISLAQYGVLMALMYVVKNIQAIWML